MSSSFGHKGTTKVWTFTGLFLLSLLFIEILSALALLAASGIFPALDLTLGWDLWGATGVPLVVCCIGIGIALARKWNKIGALALLITPVIVVLSEVVAGALLLKNATARMTFSHALQQTGGIGVLLVLFGGISLFSWYCGKAFWDAWHLRWRGVQVIGQIVTATTSHLAQHEDDQDDYRANVVFTTLAGEERSIGVSRSSRPYLPRGDLPMTYDPRKPARAVETSLSHPIPWLLGFLVLFLLYLFFCMYALIGIVYLIMEAVLGLVGLH